MSRSPAQAQQLISELVWVWAWVRAIVMVWFVFGAFCFLLLLITSALGAGNFSTAEASREAPLHVDSYVDVDGEWLVPTPCRD